MPQITIAIAGGTGSGKTTLTNRLAAYFGHKAVVLHHDDYYKKRDGVPEKERETINYDHPDALETSLLIHQIKMLQRGQSVACPVYDFTTHNRTQSVKWVPPKEILLVEGILVLADPKLRTLFDFTVFVDTEEPVRIARRIRRDIQKRGRDYDSAWKQCQATVIPMHNRFVEPTKQYADLIAHGGLDETAFQVIKDKILQSLERTESSWI